RGPGGGRGRCRRRDGSVRRGRAAHGRRGGGPRGPDPVAGVAGRLAHDLSFPRRPKVTSLYLVGDGEAIGKPRSAVPTGRVKWYDTEKGFGFLTRDDGGDVFVHKAALPTGVADLKTGQRVEFGVVESRKGNQALAVKLLESPLSVAELRRRPAEELHGLIEDMIKVLEAKIQPELRRGRFPDRKTSKTVAEVVQAVARALEV